MTRSSMVRRWAWVAVIAATLTSAVASSLPAAASATPPSRSEVRPTDPIAHDPTMVEENGWYYVAITGDAGVPHTFLPLKRSRDLVHWQELAPVFTTLPSWIVPALGIDPAAAPKDLWAPDLSYSHGEWRLYYAVSQFGENTSVIGLATTKTLDPASPGYGWHDRGLVLKSTDYRAPGGDSFNALDPNIVTEPDGQSWLSYGSFFSGIYLHRIDATGKIPSGDVAVHISQRAAPDAEENSSIVYHSGYYYLFLSFDYCCRSVESDYRTVVARSRSVTGPYVDEVGVPMLNDKGGTEVMRGYNEFVGAGGADVLLGAHGQDYVVNHYYDATDSGTPRLNVRRLSWDASGWPVVGEPINPSRTAGHGDAYVKIQPRGAATVVENVGCGYEGANVALGTDSGTLCQEWQLSYRNNGSRIQNRFSNDVAENAACNNVDGGNVAQWGWLGFLPNNDCQRWSFSGAPDGYSTISTIQPGGRSWTAEGPASTPGTNIAVDAPTGSVSQQFRFQPVGSVLLGNAQDETTTLGIAGDRVVFQPRSEQRPQEWRFVEIGSTATYRIVSTANGKLLGADLHGLDATYGHGTPSAAQTWTLAPGNDGTWTLANSITGQKVRLLLP